MFDFAVLAKRRADEADRITAVALNFEMKGKRSAFDGYQISISINNNQSHIVYCMATNEITNGCGLSTEAVLPLNRKRRRALWKPSHLLDNKIEIMQLLPAANHKTIHE